MLGNKNTNYSDFFVVHEVIYQLVFFVTVSLLSPLTRSCFLLSHLLSLHPSTNSLCLLPLTQSFSLPTALSHSANSPSLTSLLTPSSILLLSSTRFFTFSINSLALVIFRFTCLISDPRVVRKCLVGHILPASICFGPSLFVNCLPIRTTVPYPATLATMEFH